MVREIVHIQVGQCGNQVGSAFWDGVCAEHSINNVTGNYIQPVGLQDKDKDGVDDRTQNAEVYFEKKKSGASFDFVPRAVCVDLEPGTITNIKKNRTNFFRGDHLISASNGAGNNWAKGHYTEGAELVDQVLDAVRKEIEQTSCAQGFQLFHSLGGGTGSGMGTLLLLKIRDSYPDKITTTYSVFPSPKVSDTVVEPYNAVLSSHQLLENADETFIIDNEALFNIGKNVMKLDKNDTKAAYTKLNPLVAKVCLGITSSMRFPGTLNQDLRKLGVNLVPFPRLHFFLVGEGPLISDAKTKLNAKSILEKATSKSNFFANVNPEDGKSLACSLTFRGPLSASDVDKEIEAYQQKKTELFVEWIPNNIKSSIVNQAPVDSPLSATFVSNTTALKGIFQRLATQFGAMYKRKAFLHWYKGEGMDEMEFQEADKNVRDLITEYQDKQDATYAEEEEEDVSDADSV